MVNRAEAQVLPLFVYEEGEEREMSSKELFGSACDLSSHSKSVYSDEEAEQHARETGVNPRPMETKNEIDARGAFVRQANAFRVPFGNKEGEWKAEAGRYRIFRAHGCSWSNRPMIVKHILGLDNVISDQAVARSGETNKYGWGFPDAPGHRDPATGACFLSGFYKKADPEYKGRAATPSLVDVEKGVVGRIRDSWPRFTISSPRLASGST